VVLAAEISLVVLDQGLLVEVMAQRLHLHQQTGLLILAVVVVVLLQVTLGQVPQEGPV
jgi:hypothetical protein